MKKFGIFILLILFTIPSFSKVVVLNGLTHIHQGDQGKFVMGEIQVQNIGDKKERVLIYLNDLIQECNASPAYMTIGSHERSSGQWIELNTSEKILTPMEEFTIKYKINIPEEKKIQGSFWSMVMIEIVDPIKEDKLETGVTMDSKIRYGIQVITNVGNMEDSEIEFVGVELIEYEDGEVLLATAENAGIFMVTPTVVLELFDENGKQVLKTEVPFKKVYPKSCKSFEVPIEKLDAGNYEALLVADYGKSLYGTNIQIAIK